MTCSSTSLPANREINRHFSQLCEIPPEQESLDACFSRGCLVKWRLLKKRTIRCKQGIVCAKQETSEISAIHCSGFSRSTPQPLFSIPDGIHVISARMASVRKNIS